MKSILRIASALPLIVLAACASSEITSAASTEVADTRTEEQLSLDYSCLRNASISGFGTIDEEHILVYAPSRRSTYLLTTAGHCSELRFANNIKVDSRTSCVRTLDKIRVIDDLALPNGCMIKSIDRVEDRNAAKALIKIRDEKPDSEPADSTES